ncbi:hypothetical protein KIPB_014116 [Kipferlia bialata]|uniref:Uncharacterized protein n=1 Tax=Kipferlia bialata TaxID=797122 RepID=A0A9K3D8V5_9EUKA|nr:hypothetical protein KIPB_014116 [Kipferlia bialata]|eukprot:g14116.t1
MCGSLSTISVFPGTLSHSQEKARDQMLRINTQLGKAKQTLAAADRVREREAERQAERERPETSVQPESQTSIETERERKADSDSLVPEVPRPHLPPLKRP